MRQVRCTSRASLRERLRWHLYSETHTPVAFRPNSGCTNLRRSRPLSLNAGSLKRQLLNQSTARQRKVLAHQSCGLPARRAWSQPNPPLGSLRSSFAGVVLLCAAVTVVALAVTSLPALVSPAAGTGATTEPPEDMALAILPGRPGNLTPEQEEKLRRLWRLILQITGVDQPAEPGEQTPPPLLRRQSSGGADRPKKKRASFFSRRPRADTTTEAPAAAAAAAVAKLSLKDLGDEDDKYGQTRQFYDALASQTPESIRATIWSMVKHDHPDALVLRFLRARKWDVGKALVMFVSTMRWRGQEMHVDDDIMKNGELAAAVAEKSDDKATQRLGHDFLAQIRLGKSFVHGIDDSGRPICIVRVRLHRQGEQAEESLERYTVYLIETTRMLLAPPVDTASIVFDMTDFSLANMDYTPVKFMIKCFEANYPESLGVVLVHKAPWIFQGIWKIIKGWLDPVVAGKVHFSNNIKELEQFISRNRIPKELDGEEEWQYRYDEPAPTENDKMQDTTGRDALLSEREHLYKDFEAATLEWIKKPATEQSQELKSRRDEIALRLRQQYWTLDPYIRARSWYDRIGVLQPGGTLDFYPAAKPVKVEEQAEQQAEVRVDVQADVQTEKPSEQPPSITEVD